MVTAIEGFGCKRGKVYGTNEFLHPVRILTSTVKVTGQEELLAVRSEEPIPKELIMDCMKVIAEKTVSSTPVKRYDVIIPDIWHPVPTDSAQWCFWSSHMRSNNY